MNYQLPTVQNSVSATRRWKSVCVPIVLAALLIATVNTVHAQKRLIDHFPDAAQSGCMACHSEVEPIREIGSEMLNQIMQKEDWLIGTYHFGDRCTNKGPHIRRMILRPHFPHHDL